MTYRQNILKKLYWLVFFNIIIWIICSLDLKTSLLGKLPTVFKVTFTAFSLCGLIMFLIHEAHLLRNEYSIRKKLANFLFFYVLIGFGAIFAVLWLEMGYFGFYPVFIWTMVIYAWLAFLTIAALDLKPMKEQSGSKGMANMMVFYLILCVGYTTIGYALPQYDPQYEIKKLIGDRGDLSKADKETLIKVGGEIFRDFECFNCHNTAPGGIKKRGPNLAATDIGGDENILINIVEPQKVTSKGFDQPKIRNAMPDYYGKQIKPLELKAIVEYLKNARAEASISTKKMPEGWWTDTKVIAGGKKIFEGLFSDNPKIACMACHGKEGIPLSEKARDFREKKYMNSLSDKQIFYSVTNGVLDKKGNPTLMADFEDLLSPAQRWQVIAYVFKQFVGGGNGRKGVDYTAGAENTADAKKKEKKIWRPWPWK
ncbi:MAG: c-type cytochrome [Candidatus Anammoxibacter sp.]